MGLVHAELYNASKSPEEPVEVMFNPTEYGIDRSVSYAEVAVPGLPMPLLQFVRGESQTLSLELFLDGSRTREAVGEDASNTVESKLAELRKFVEIDSDLHTPPLCRFKWGQVDFLGVVTSLQERFALFKEDGRILRARVTLSLKSFEAADVQYRRINRQSPDRTKTWVVKEGERLDQIAAAEYNDPTLWRAIARANGMHRPRALVPGQVLRIPAL